MKSCAREPAFAVKRAKRGLALEQNKSDLVGTRFFVIHDLQPAAVVPSAILAPYFCTRGDRAVTRGHARHRRKVADLCQPNGDLRSRRKRGE